MALVTRFDLAPASFRAVASRVCGVCRRTSLIALIGVLTPLLATASITDCNAQVTLLHSFTGTGKAGDGSNAKGGVIQASDGNLYGTCENGGANNYGTIFRVGLSGNFTPFYSFTGGSDGAWPIGGLVQAWGGKLYGNCQSGGPNNGGTIFKIDLNKRFTLICDAWHNPLSGLMQASDGSLYGTTGSQGFQSGGTIFRTDQNGSFEEIFSFFDYFNAPDGVTPLGTLTEASDSNLYGTCYSGGANWYGTIFKIDRLANVTLLYSFTAMGSTGTNSDGANPVGGLVQASDGYLYGTCYKGGAYGYGTIFRVDLLGNFTTLYSFTGGSDGANPTASLMQASDGNLYGTCLNCGAHLNGTIFKIDISGNFTPLYSFLGPLSKGVGAYDGADPYAGLIEASDGNLYGTCTAGGAYGAGTVFRYSLHPTAPVLTSLSPSQTAAGSPQITLTATGSNFTTDATLYFGSTALSTTVVSGTKATAPIPANLLTSPGQVSVTVHNSAGASNGLPFTIQPVPHLALAVGTLSRDSSGNIDVPITVSNNGTATAQSVTIKSPTTLNGKAASTTLPISLGSIAVGSNAGATLVFPGSAGKPGSKVTLSVTVSYTGHSVRFQDKVTLP